jgi:hypothetical protein
MVRIERKALRRSERIATRIVIARSLNDMRIEYREWGTGNRGEKGNGKTD